MSQTHHRNFQTAGNGPYPAGIYSIFMDEVHLLHNEGFLDGYTDMPRMFFPTAMIGDGIMEYKNSKLIRSEESA